MDISQCMQTPKGNSYLAPGVPTAFTLVKPLLKTDQCTNQKKEKLSSLSDVTTSVCLCLPFLRKKILSDLVTYYERQYTLGLCWNVSVPVGVV